MDEETRDRVLLKILESLDKIRKGIDLLNSDNIGKGQWKMRDPEIDELLGKRKTLYTMIPLDDKLGKPEEK